MHPKYNASAEYSQVKQLCETTHKLDERDEAHCLRKSFRRHENPSMNIDITGALFTLRIQYEYTQTQCKEGASDANFQ